MLFADSDTYSSSSDNQAENMFESWLPACDDIDDAMKVDLSDLDDISIETRDSLFVCNMPSTNDGGKFSASSVTATLNVPVTSTPDSSVSMDDRPKAVQPTTKPAGRPGSTHIHLWQFLKELLSTPLTHGNAIRWLDRSKGVFKIEDSVRVAQLWGKRKNRPAMNYDKLSRSIRQYYKKGIMKKTERSQRLVYQFCTPYAM